MKTDIRSNRDLPFIIFAITTAFTLLVAGPHAANAQQPQTITATGTITGDSGKALPFNVTFPPAGGKVTGVVDYSYEMTSGDASCSGIVKINMEGTFAGGDGGAVTGTGSGTGELGCDDGTSLTVQYNGPWSGNFYANGTGNGIFDLTGYIGSFEGSFQVPWQVTFSAQEFQAALGESDSAPVAPEDAPSGPVTSESIYNTYGIKVEDTFSEDPNVSKSWSDEELILLNDVLKELPPGFAKKLAVARIVRASRDPDHPDWVGGYYPCDGRGGKEPCTAETATIRIYDGALHAFDFENDPDGYKEFKGTILHELTHALQSYKDPNEIYLHPTEQLLQKYARSPLVQNYMDATRPVTDMNEPGFWQNNGWNLVLNKWNLTGANGNETPTNYAKKNPQEDLSESVMMYVYDPQKLQNSSAKRYTFIRDQIFGGIEYEDGHQKQP